MKIIILLFSLINFTQVSLASAKTFYFVVHPKNTEPAIELERAKNIILKKIKRWDSGNKIQVFLPDGSSFPHILKGVFNMDTFRWEEYWGEETLRTGMKPPLRLKSELSIIRNISKNKKAFGILSDTKFNIENNKKLKVVLKIEI
ncbi:MAG: hypothetical protein HON90_10860 [Halobacteriovoraceae bacterium]|jgi:hypothetical protein|nr:hypothetical protein [Halobacteriovoraceae bacterium]